MQILLFVFFIALAGYAQESLLSEDVRAWFAAESAKAPKGEQIFSPLGLVADREKRVVDILAVAMGVKGNEPMEFFLVGANGKDYESMGATVAKPSDIQKALIFIGMTPGRSISFRELAFWPKGDRVNATVAWETETGWSEPVRMERMVLDQRSQTHMPENGLVFVGSRYDEVGEPPRREFGADNTGNIATTYNDPWTVLDVPYKYRQADVYNNLIANPKYPLRSAQKLRIRLQPQLAAGETRVFSGGLTLSGQEADAQSAIFTMRDAAGETVMNGNFSEFLTYLQPRVATQDIHLGITVGAAMPVAPLRELCSLLRELEKQQILRPEGVAGHFFYEAFLPEEKWRERTNQASHPVELYLAPTETEAVAGTLVYLEDIYEKEGKRQELLQWPFANPRELQALLKKRENWWTDDVFLDT
ncbi:MAG: hypothetical protein ACI8W8_001656, partial [Rhodothermales bacterium]